MNIHDRRTRSLKSDAVAGDLPGEAIHTRGKGGKAGRMLSLLLICFLLTIFTSFCVMTDVVMADKVKEIKEEVKEGVNETKEELKKMPEELKKAGKEIKKKTEDVKKTVEADIEEGKKNVRSLTK